MRVLNLKGRKFFMGELYGYGTTVEVTEDNMFYLKITSNKTPDIPGSLHFLEHLLIGSEIFKTMRNNPGLYLNAYTNINSITLTANFKYTDEPGIYTTDDKVCKRNLESVESFIKSVLKKCTYHNFTDTEVESERNVILSEFYGNTCDYNETTSQISQLLLLDLINLDKVRNTSGIDGILTQRSVYGREEDIQSVTTEDLNKLNKGLFTSKNSYVNITIPKSLLIKLIGGEHIESDGVIKALNFIYDTLNHHNVLSELSRKCEKESDNNESSFDIVEKDLRNISKNVTYQGLVNEHGDTLITHSLHRTEEGSDSQKQVYFTTLFNDDSSLTYNVKKLLVSVDRIIINHLSQQVFNKVRENGGAVYAPLFLENTWFKNNNSNVDFKNQSETLGFNINNYDKEIGNELRNFYNESVEELLKGDNLSNVIDEYIEYLVLDPESLVSTVNKLMIKYKEEIDKGDIEILSKENPFNLKDYINDINKFKNKEFVSERIKNKYNFKITYIIQD